MVCQLVIRPDCQNADFSEHNFVLLGHFFVPNFVKSRRQLKMEIRKKYNNFIYSVSVPAKPRTYRVLIFINIFTFVSPQKSKCPKIQHKYVTYTKVSY